MGMPDQTGGGVTTERIDSLLVGAVDLHIHSGPSVMARGLTHIDMLRAAPVRRTICSAYQMAVRATAM